jgi:hypothetical protein
MLQNDPRPVSRPFTLPHITSARLSMNEYGFILHTKVKYDNPTPVAIKLGTASVGVQLFDFTVFRMGISNFNLVRDVGEMDPILQFDIVSKDYKRIGKLSNLALAEFVKSGSFPLKFVGPVMVKPMGNPRPLEWIQKMTEYLGINFPPELFSLFVPKYSSSLSKMVSKLLQVVRLKTSFIMDDDEITMPIQIKLPKLIELPSVAIDYDLSAALFFEDMKLARITIETIQFPKGNNSENVISATIKIHLEENEAASAAMANVVDKLWDSKDGPTVNVRQFELIQKGKSKCSWCSEYISQIDFAIPVPSFLIKDTLLDLASSFSEWGGNGPLSVGRLELKQEPDKPIVNVFAKLDLNMPSVVIEKISIPFMKADLRVNNVPFISISLPRGIHFTSNSSTIDIHSQFLFLSNNAAKESLKDAFDHYFGRTHGLSRVSLSGFVFGGIKTPSILFEQAQSYVTTDDLYNLMVAGPSPLQNLKLPSGMIKPISFDYEQVKGSAAVYSIKVDYLNPFNFFFHIGDVSFTLLLNNHSIIDFKIPSFPILPAGRHVVEVNNVKSSSSNSKHAQESVSQLFSKFLSGNPFNDTLAVIGFTMGSNSSRIDTFSRSLLLANLNPLPVKRGNQIRQRRVVPIRLQNKTAVANPHIPLQNSTQGKLPGGNGTQDQPAAIQLRKSFFDLSSLLTPSIKSNGTSLLSGQVTAVTGNTIRIALCFRTTNPFPLSFRIPYLSFAIGLGENEFLHISNNGLAIQRGHFDLKFDLTLQYSNIQGVQKDVATLMSEFFSNQPFSGTTYFSQVILGSSENLHGKMFSKIKLSVPLKSISSLLDRFGTGLYATLLPSSNRLVPQFNQFAFSKFKMATLPDSQLSISSNFGFNQSIPVGFDLPYISFKFGFNGIPTVQLTARNLKLVPGTKSGTIDATLKFLDVDINQLAPVIGDLYDGFFKKNILNLSSVLLGTSEKETINSYLSMNLSFLLSSLFSEEKLQAARRLVPEALARMLQNPTIALSDLQFNTQTPGVIRLDVASVFPSPVFDFDFKYFSAFIGMHEVPDRSKSMMKVEFFNLKMQNGRFSATALFTPTESAENTLKMRALMETWISNQLFPNVFALTGGFKFGVSPQDYIKLLSVPFIYHPLRSLFPKPLRLPHFNRHSLKMTGIAGISAHVVDRYNYRFQAQIPVYNSFPISGVIGFGAMDLYHSGTLIGSIASDQPFALLRGNAMMEVSFAITLNKNPNVEGLVADLIQKIANLELKSILLGASGIRIGATPSSYTNLLSLVRVAQTIPIRLPAITSNSLSFISGKASFALTPTGVSAQVPIRTPWAMTVTGVQDVLFDAFTNGALVLRGSVGGASLQNINQFNAQVALDINLPHMIPFVNRYYESAMIGLPIPSLHVGNAYIRLSNGEVISWFSKIMVAIPAYQFQVPKIKFKLRGVTGLDVALSLQLPVHFNLNLGNVAFDVYTAREKIAEMRQPITFDSQMTTNVFVKATLPIWKVGEWATLIGNLNDEYKYLRSWMFTNAHGAPVAWLGSLLNAINVRILPKCGVLGLIQDQDGC